MNYKDISDKKLVGLLLQEDMNAWDYVLTELVAPICYSRKYTEICAKNSISPDSLITRVWMLLRNNDYRKLHLFRGDSSFTTYLFIVVREAQRYEVREKNGKISLVLSEDDTYCSQIMSREGSDSAELQDEMRFANELFAGLWQENPQQALVLLMRNALNLSAREVASFLNESAGNVDQMNSRAKTKMRKLRRGNE